MRLSKSVTRKVAPRLGHYVYVYINPIDNSVFYIGKGQRSRCLIHLDAGNREVRKTIEAIRDLGKEPRIEILAKNLKDAKAAHTIETAAIELFGIDKLGNLVRGHRSKELRTPIEDVIASLSFEPAKITEPSVLIRIKQFYFRGMSDVELYDATRSCWKIAEWRQARVKLAFAIFEGVIREVYEITAWHPAGQTFCTYRGGRRSKPNDPRCKGKSEFVGVIASDAIRDKYLNKRLKFKKGAINAVQFINV